MTFIQCRSAILTAMLKAGLHGMIWLCSLAFAPNLIFLLGCRTVHCIAVGCSNRSHRDSRRGISFHFLPLKYKGLLRKWLAQINRENLPQMKHCHVCSEHFEPTCFESEYRVDILPDNLSRHHLKQCCSTVFQHKKVKPKAIQRMLNEIELYRKR